MNKNYFNSWITALLLYPLIVLIGWICQIYSYSRYDEFFMAGFFIHGYLVVAHPFAKYSLKSIGFTYLAGFFGSIVGYINESNSIVIALLAVMTTLHFTSTPTQKALEFEKLDKKEQKKISNINWLKSMGIGIVALIIGATLMNSVKTLVNNDLIQKKLKGCTKSEFKNFKDSDAVAIAKCYGDDEKLEYIKYYSQDGRVDDIYVFTNGELDTLYNYYIGNKVHYLKSKTIITSTKTRFDKPYIYKGIRVTYDYGTRLPHRYEEVIVNYIEDKQTVYIPDGLEIFCDKNGDIKRDVGVINKEDKMVSSKKLTAQDIEIFHELYPKPKKEKVNTHEGWFQKSLK